MIKVAVLGPESTGKSSLSLRLSEHFNALWVPEYAREYVESLTEPYTYEDVCNIARKQLEQEAYYSTEQFESEKGYIFFDTDLIITSVWFEYCYGVVPEFLTERLNTGYFDIYLLCSPDLPWEPDPVREHGHDRDYFFDWYKRKIEETGKPFLTVTGQGTDRLNNALKALAMLSLNIN